MKKTSFLFVAALCTSFIARADFFVTKSGGGPNGYSRVQQTTANGNTTLDCTGSGYDQCTAVNPPASTTPSVPKIAVDNAISEVDLRISNGQTSGQLYLNGYNVNWQGSNAFNYSMSIN